MNLTLHWLRRDLRRHAPALALWALLVALFTWARIWFRTHPHVFIGDRDLWLSVPAVMLGFTEVFLLLQVMYDDPARGAQGFWKTRPPSGLSVFGAKAVIFVLVSLVIPLVAESIFLVIVGPSAGTGERIAVYLLPPVLALSAGVAACHLKNALIWIPIALTGLAAAVFAPLWLLMRESLQQIADDRLVAGAALLAALAGSAMIYRRRTPGCVLATAVVLAPGLIAFGIACTGWPRDPRLSNPPPGLDASAIQVSWLRPVEVIRTYGGGQWVLRLPLHFHGLPPSLQADGTIQKLSVSGKAVSLRGAETLEGERTILSYGGKPGFDWSVLLNEADANQLRANPMVITGTVVLRFSECQRHSIPVHGTHSVEAGPCRWTITPVVHGSDVRRNYYGDLPDTNDLWYRYERIDFSPRNWRGRTSSEGQPALLRRKTSDQSVALSNFNLGQRSNLWEGVGREQERLQLAWYDESVRGVAARELRDPEKRKDWILEFGTATLCGTVRVPFRLESPAAAQQTTP